MPLKFFRRLRKIMGKCTPSTRHTLLGWCGIAIMLVAVVAMFLAM